MILKKIISLCTKTERVCTLQQGEVQWLGNEQAFYALSEEIPWLSESMFCAAFDIKSKKADKIAFSFGEPIPEGYDFTDKPEDEIQVERINGIGVQWQGRTLIPFKASDGIAYLDKAHFAPLADLDDNLIYIFERRSKDGVLFFAVKFGFEVVAVLLPYNNINKDFSEELSALAELTNVRVSNMLKSKEGAE